MPVTVLTPKVSSVSVTPTDSSVVVIEHGAHSVNVVDSVTVVNTATVESTVVVAEQSNSSVNVTDVTTAVIIGSQDLIGNLSALSTTDQNNVVGAVNEVSYSLSQATSTLSDALDLKADTSYVDDELTTLSDNLQTTIDNLDVIDDSSATDSTDAVWSANKITNVVDSAVLTLSNSVDTEFQGVSDALDLKDNITDVDSKFEAKHVDSITSKSEELRRSILHRRSLIRTQSNIVNVVDSAINVDNRGPTGPTGPQGEVGAAGAAGLDGIYGGDGTDGTNGTDGIDGTDGVDGSDGYIPVKDVDYFDGAAGIQGPVGPQAPGLKGDSGPDGADSTVPGPPGQDGADGAGSTFDATSIETDIANIQNDLLIDSFGGGYTAKITASGTLPDGCTVILKDDGTVEAVNNTLYIPEYTAVRTSTVADSTRSYSMSSAFLPNNPTKFLLAYGDVYGSNYGYVRVGSISGTDITFGDKVSFSADNISECHIAFAPNTSGQFVITYIRPGYYEGNTLLGTMSGDSITFESPTLISTNMVSMKDLVVDTASETGQFLMVYEDIDDSNTYKAQVLTISGNTIVSGTEQPFAEASKVAFDPTTQGRFAVLTDDASGGVVNLGTISGNSFTLGSSFTFSAIADGEVDFSNIAFDPVQTGKFVVAYSNDTGSGTYSSSKLVVGTVSGTSISFGTSTVYAVDTATLPSFAFDHNRLGHFALSYRNKDTPYATYVASGVVAGISVSIKDTSQLNVSQVQTIEVVHCGLYEGRFIAVYSDWDTNVGYPTATVFDITAGGYVSNAVQENFLGTSTAAYTDGQEATIMLQGGLSSNQTGLVAGSTYYVFDDGTLSLTVGTPPIVAGRALSSTSLLLSHRSYVGGIPGLRAELDTKFNQEDTDARIIMLAVTPTKVDIESLAIDSGSLTGILPALDGSALLMPNREISTINGLQPALDELTESKFDEDDTDTRILMLDTNVSKSEIEALGILASSLTGPLPAIDGSALYLPDREIYNINELQDNLDLKYEEEDTDARILMLNTPVTRSQINELGMESSSLYGPLPALDGSALIIPDKGIANTNGLQEALDLKFDKADTDTRILMLDSVLTKTEVEALGIRADSITGPLPAIDGSNVFIPNKEIPFINGLQDKLDLKFEADSLDSRIVMLEGIVTRNQIESLAISASSITGPLPELDASALLIPNKEISFINELQSKLDAKLEQDSMDARILMFDPLTSRAHVESLRIDASTLTGALPAIDGASLLMPHRPISDISGLQYELDLKQEEGEAVVDVLVLDNYPTRSSIEALGVRAVSLKGPLPAIDGSALLIDNKEISFINGLQDKLDSSYAEEDVDARVLMLNPTVTKKQIEALQISANSITGPLPAIDGSALLMPDKEISFIVGLQDELDSKYSEDDSDARILMLESTISKTQIEALQISASSITGPLPAIDGSALLIPDKEISHIIGLQEHLDTTYTEEDADARILMLESPITKTMVDALGVSADSLTGDFQNVNASALVGTKEVSFIDGLQDSLSLINDQSSIDSRIIMLDTAVTKRAVDQLGISASSLTGEFQNVNASALTGTRDLDFINGLADALSIVDQVSIDARILMLASKTATSAVNGLAEYSKGHTTVETTINSTTPFDVGIRAKLNPASGTQLIRVNWQWSYQNPTEETSQAHKLEYRLDGGSWVDLITWSSSMNHVSSAANMTGSSNLSWSGLASELSAEGSVLEFRILVAVQDTGFWVLNEDFGTGSSSTGQLTFIEAHMYDGSIYTVGTNV